MSEAGTWVKTIRGQFGVASRHALDSICRAARKLRPVVEVVQVVAGPVAVKVSPVVLPGVRASVRLLRVPSMLGWTVSAVAVFAWLLAVLWGWQELSTWAFVAVVLILAAIPFVLGKLAYVVKLDLANSRVTVGERAVGRLEVSNAAKHPLLPARIELPVGDGEASFQLPRLAVAAVHEDLFTIPTQRRTVLTVGPVKSVRGDALGLLRREVTWTDPVELFVHPRTVPLSGSTSGFFRDLEGLPTKDLSNDDVSFHALREYVPGDDRRYVHWKSSARTGKLMVRQFEETRRSHLGLALSTNPEHYADDEEFELAVSVCGSIALQTLREEKELTVLTQEGLLPAPTGSRLLDGLAAVRPLGETLLRQGRAELHHFAQTTAAEVRNASVVALIFGGTVDPKQIQGAVRKVPFGIRVTAIQCIPGEKLRLRTISGASLLTVGDLHDLSLGMRRVSE